MPSQFLSSSEDKVKDYSGKKNMPYKVFFKDLFLFKENEMEAKKKEKFINRSMKVHQKSTFSSRMKSRSHLSQLSFYSDKGGVSFDKYGLDPALILRLTEGSDSKRTVHEFINDQRDRFLLEYALSTKRNKIMKFEKLIALKERQLMKAEKKLQEDSIAFEEFLRENDQRSADALKIAAQETINKLQVTAELKKASMEVQAVKSEITKTEFLLKEYMKYGRFLLKLSPKHWQLQQALKRAQASKNKENMNVILSKRPKTSAKMKESHEGIMKTSLTEDSAVGSSSQGGKQQKTIRNLSSEHKRSISNQAESISSEDSFDFFLDGDIDYDLEPELYFKEPEELLQVLNELEEQNLTLVQYSQDVDENLEDINKREKLIHDKINSNIDFLLEHKNMLKESCVREEEKAAELELRSRLFSFGQFNSDAQKRAFGQNATWKEIKFARKFIEILSSEKAWHKLATNDANFLVVPTHIINKFQHYHQQIKRRSSQEKLIDSLSRKINQVYRICIGDAEVGSLNPVQKLVKVESRLVELSDLIESIPKENVEAIERIKHKERRQKLREEKMKEKQRHQEERLKVALQRAVAQPKKKVGRRLMYRSQPPSANKHELLLVRDTKTKSQEDEYFFT
ncbi:coiled-coil domain-containing protein 38 isoform X2 [Talpa occidentalis]|uniref:coiled-coil domain-containing protein 38 isoform X2 n=1 Tax=Talpa occidentalis TaxID=50954 RepID=UPI0023F89148|nr:coiled-coil domain-containing protein 38 isoform X2 [Talpa occidentalis]